MKFLIAGFGSIGRRHFHNLLALGERDILFYRRRNGSSAAVPQSTLPTDELAGYVVETDLTSALSHRPDAVIIANPTALHLDVAIPAARAGCHLLIEKPISHSMDKITEFEAAWQHGGGQVLVGYQFRFHPGLRMVAELLGQGMLGRILSFRAHWGEYLPGWHPWEDYRRGYSARIDLGGGVILTLSHPLDYLLWLLGEVRAVWAFASHLSNLEIDVEDTAEIGIQFENGVIGSLHLDYNQQPVIHHLEIIGTSGTIRWDNQNGGVSYYCAQEKTWKDYLIPLLFERNDLFLAEMRHFLDIIHTDIAPVCSWQEGVADLQLALAALQSAREGKMISCRIA